MLRLIFRKILNNKWMVICLIIGCTFAIAVAAAIPMYTSGMYNVLLANEFKKEQDKFSTFPFKASYNATFFGLNNNTSQTIFNDLDNTFYNEYIANMPVNKVFDYKNVTTKSYSMFDEQNYKIKQQKIDDGEQLSSRNLNVKSDFSITSAANAPDMLDIIGGRMFQTSTEEGVIEAVITQLQLQYRLSVGEYYYIYNKILDVDLIAKVKIVGIVKVNESSSSFFTLSDRTLLVDFDQMQNMIKESLITLQQANWFAAFDYTTVRLEFNEDIIKDTQTLKVSDGNSRHIL